jgi:septum formation protein
MMILASTSASRQRLLRDAGVTFEAVAPHVDEVELTASLLAEQASPRMIADALAEAKAVKVSRRYPGALVLGSDTVLCYDNNQMLDKPTNMADIAQHLRILSGQTHELISAAVFAQDGKAVWRAIETPKLTMRVLSDAYIAHYVEQVGTEVLGSVGAYHLEGRGAQLFASVSGDYFSILGLPLLAVLDYLRVRNIMVA